MIAVRRERSGDEPLAIVFNLDQLDVSTERSFDGVPFAFNPTGEIVAVSSDDGVWLCDFETGEKLFKLRDYSSRVIAFSPDSRFIAAVEGLGSISIWAVPAD
jgi:WD40 repeat protein